MNRSLVKVEGKTNTLPSGALAPTISVTLLSDAKTIPSEAA